MTEAAQAAAPGSRALRRRLAVTAGVAAFALVGARVPLPFVDGAALAGLARRGAPAAGVLALGLGPFLAASVLVELAALAWPGWRRLRHGSAPGRRALFGAAWKLALVLATVQAHGLVAFLRAARGLGGEPLLAPGAWPALAVELALVSGALLLTWLATRVGEHGLGNGFAVLLTVGVLEQLGGAAGRLADAYRAGGLTDLQLALLLCALLVGGWLVGRALRGGPAPATPRVPVPTCGLVPLHAAGQLAMLALALAGSIPALAPLAGGVRGDGWPALALALALAPLLARLFCAPIAVLGAWARAEPERFDAGQAAAVRAALRRAHLRSLWLVAGLGVLPPLAGALGGDLVLTAASPALLALLVAVGLDLADEVRARSRGGPLAVAHALHVVHAVEPILEALARAGIPALARGRHFRALFHFFAPYAPIELLVPPDRAVEADAICTRIVCGGDGGDVLVEPVPAAGTPA